MKPYARVKFTLEEKKNRAFVPILASCSYKVTKFNHSEYTDLSYTSHFPQRPYLQSLYLNYMPLS